MARLGRVDGSLHGKLLHQERARVLPNQVSEVEDGG